MGVNLIFFEKIGAELIFIILGIYLSCMDFKYLRLPDTAVFLLLWSGLFFNLNHLFSSLNQAVLGVILGYGFLWLVYWVFKYFTGKEGLGYGDFKLLGALGAWFGCEELFEIILIASVFSLIFYVFLNYLNNKNKILKIPLGPGILCAGFLELFRVF